jgi:hypothetical protein
MATPEWNFQRAAVVYLSAVLPLGSEIQGNDTRGKQSIKLRQLDAARGIRAGWPDLVCVVSGFPEIYIELKAPGGRLSDEQERRGRVLRTLGRVWFVAQALEQIEVELLTLGVPLRGTMLSAVDRDARIAAPKGHNKPPRARAAKPTARGLAKIAKARHAGIFT